MGKLKKLVEKVFYEDLWEATCVLRSDRNRNITKLTDNLRSICGLTVVTVASPAENISETVEKTELRVKFHKSVPGHIRNQLRKMAMDALQIDGVFSFIPRGAQKVRSRIYRE